MGDDLQFLRPEAADWRAFLLAAEGEGWRVPATELELFHGPLSESALALRCEGRFAGLVTLVNHGQSAWIGNLIVPAAWRGRGYGKHLLEKAILRLEKQRTRSIWLTASEAGFPLYRRRGFETIGQVERWVLPGGGASHKGATQQSQDSAALQAADAAVWGERRPLLNTLLQQGRSLCCGASVALLQREPGLQILGPWFAANAGEEEHRRMLDMAIAAANTDEELVVDVRSGAFPPQVLADAGFALRGRTRLMVRGSTDGVDLQPLISFASLGSMG